MKLKEPLNPNYAATIVSIKTTVPLEGRDNIVGAPLLGMQAIVSRDTKVGDIGVLFVAETQLSPDYLKQNNLYRESDLNKDKSKKGFIEHNGRVKAIKLGGHRSDALFMPLSSLSFTKVKIDELNEGDAFEELNGVDICKKYEVRRKISRVDKNKNTKKVFRRVDDKMLPEHYDSDQYFRVADSYKPDTQIILTQKLHGTSIRAANTIVKRKITFTEEALKKLGVNIKEYEYDYVFGSRKVIKDPNNKSQNHFYVKDVWTEAGKKFEGLIPEGYVVYGELIGWTEDGAPLQKGYTYNVPHSTNEVYVYRVAFINPQGVIVDLSWDQVKEWCIDRGLKHVPELWRGKHSELVPEDWLDKKYHEDGLTNAVPLSAESPADEGVCVRVDRLAPYITKIKSPLFYQHETKMIDEEAVDMEEEGKNE